MTLPGLLAGHRLFAQTHDHAAMTASAADGEFNPSIVSDNHGGFLFGFVERKSGLSNVFLQRASSAGSFAPRIRVNDRAGDAAVRNENPPKFAAGPNDEIYAAWASERERWKGNVRFARSLNGGKSFEPAISLNSDAAQAPVSRAFQAILADGKGRVFVAWIDERDRRTGDRGAEIWMAVSQDRGKTFSKDRRILSNVCECCRLALAMDPAGGIYLSYRTVPASGPMLRDIAVARSLDDGRTFQPSLVSRDNWAIDACPIAGASMTVDSAGRVHVVWFTQPGDRPRLFVATSADRGLTFTRPFVFDASQKLAKHAHVAALPDRRLLIAWDDLDGVSTVKWGLYDTETRSMRLLGTEARTSYPIAAVSGNQLAVAALRAEGGGVFRRVQSLAGR